MRLSNLCEVRSVANCIVECWLVAGELWDKGEDKVREGVDVGGMLIWMGDLRGMGRGMVYGNIYGK